MLDQVKAPNAMHELSLALTDDALVHIRRPILSAIWNAGLDAREHLEMIVDIAISGVADECFECLTIIENQEVWPEKDARKAIARVKKAAAIEQHAYKAAILNDLTGLLEERLGMA
jgi:hypothetical protein